jgi:hypothetical protein
MIASRKCNIIHTRLRHECSSLGVDLFRASIINNPSCPCGCPLEDDIHYLCIINVYINIFDKQKWWGKKGGNEIECKFMIAS